MNTTTSPTQFTRRGLIQLFVAGGATIYLAGCSSSASAGKASGSKTLKYTTSWDPTSSDPRAKSQAAIIKAFTAKYDVQVELTYVPFDQANTQLILEAQGGRSPDVSLQMDVNLLTLIQQKAIQPLDQFTGSWSAARKADYLFPWDDMVFNGKQYAFRQSPRPANALFYRKDVFSAQNLVPPTTADNWLQTATELSGSGKFGFGIPLGNTNDLNRFMAGFTSMIWARGGDIFDLNTNRPTFAEDAGVYAMDWMRSMVSKGALARSAATASADTVDQQFTAGAIRTTLGNTGNLGSYQSSKSGDWVGVADMPNFANDTSKPGPAYLAGGWTMVMPKGANQDLAWKFLEFYQDPQAEVLKSSIGGELPTRKSVLDNSFYKTPAAANMRDWLAWLQANPKAAPLKVPQYQNMVQQMYNACQAVMVKGMSSQKALQQASDAYAKTI